MAKGSKYTIADFNRDFPSEDACLEAIVGMVYPDGITCRKCGMVRPHAKLTNRKAYSCDYCGTHVYPLAGTIFEKSTTPLKSWFYAMYIMGSTRCGISAKQLERELGVTYKTAWRIFDQIRKLMAEDGGLLQGEVAPRGMSGMGTTRRSGSNRVATSIVAVKGEGLCDETHKGSVEAGEAKHARVRQLLTKGSPSAIRAPGHFER